MNNRHLRFLNSRYKRNFIALDVQNVTVLQWAELYLFRLNDLSRDFTTLEESQRLFHILNKFITTVIKRQLCKASNHPINSEYCHVPHHKFQKGHTKLHWHCCLRSKLCRNSYRLPIQLCGACVTRFSLVVNITFIHAKGWRSHPNSIGRYQTREQRNKTWQLASVYL